MERETAIQRGLALIKRAKTCLLGTNGDDGFPNIKAMLNYMADGMSNGMKPEGMNVIWFATLTDSNRVRHLLRDNRACVYYMDDDSFEGLMLVGTVEVLRDPESRRMLWKDGYEVYYPGGVDDPNYTVLKFTTHWANYYAELSNITFKP